MAAFSLRFYTIRNATVDFYACKLTLAVTSPAIMHYSSPLNSLIIQRVVFFLSICREPTTRPANNCPQKMVCQCVVPFKPVLLQIIFCSCVIRTKLSREKWQIVSLSCQEVVKIWKQNWWSNDKIIIELGYRKISLFVNVSQINCLPQPSALANNWSI